MFTQNKHIIFMSSLVLIMGLGLTFLLYSHKKEIIKSTSLTALNSHAKKHVKTFESTTRLTILSIERIARRWEAAKGTSVKVWKSDTENYVKDFGFIQAIEWVDKTNRVKWIEPMEGNRAALNLDLGFEKKRRTALEKAKMTLTTHLTHVVELKQKDLGFLSFSPIHFDNKHQGFIVGVFKTQDLFNRIFKFSDIKYIVKDGDMIIAKSKNYDQYTERQRKKLQYVKIPIHLKNLEWNAVFHASPEFLAGLESEATFGILVFGIIFSFVLAFLIGTIMVNNQKSAQLMSLRVKTINQEKLASLGTMAGGMAHEINNPLAIVSSTAQSALKAVQLKDYERVEKRLRKIPTEVQRISKIVNSMLIFSDSHSAKTNESISSEELFNLVKSVTDNATEQSKINLIFKSEKNLNLNCSSKQIVQVIVNLITNSIDEIVEKDLPEKWIIVESKSVGDLAEISVTDSGHGISKDIADKILDPFFTTKAVGKGTGLGLSLSNGLLEQNFSSLKIDTESRNTKFYFCLRKTKQQELPYAA